MKSRALVALLRMFSEPLLYLLLIGAALFLLQAVTSHDGGAVGGKRIVLTAAVREQVAQRFARTWGRAPSAEEVQLALDDWVREEVLYREGLAMELFEGDPIVRRRLGQQLMMLAEAAVPVEASDTALADWLAAHREAYRDPQRYSFEQRYFTADTASAALRRQRDALNAGEDSAMGEASLLPARLENAAATYVASTFGDAFLKQLAALTPGRWEGPLRSAFGLHLVRLDAVEGGGIPEAAAIRDLLLRDWVAEQKRLAREHFYRALRDSYEVVDGSAASGGAGEGATP